MQPLVISDAVCTCCSCSSSSLCAGSLPVVASSKPVFMQSGVIGSQIDLVIRQRYFIMVDHFDDQVSYEISAEIGFHEHLYSGSSFWGDLIEPGSPVVKYFVFFPLNLRLSGNLPIRFGSISARMLHVPMSIFSIPSQKPFCPLIRMRKDACVQSSHAKCEQRYCLPQNHCSWAKFFNILQNLIFGNQDNIL